MTAAAGWPDFLANPGVFAAAVAEAAPHERSFLNDHYRPADFPRWAAETRARFVDLLRYAPPACDPAPQVIDRQDHGDFARETLLFSTAPWCRVPCDVLVPKRLRDGRWPAPAIVGLHCHGGVFR